MSTTAELKNLATDQNVFHGILHRKGAAALWQAWHNSEGEDPNELLDVGKVLLERVTETGSAGLGHYYGAQTELAHIDLYRPWANGQATSHEAVAAVHENLSRILQRLIDPNTHSRRYNQPITEHLGRIVHKVVLTREADLYHFALPPTPGTDVPDWLDEHSEDHPACNCTVTSDDGRLFPGIVQGTYPHRYPMRKGIHYLELGRVLRDAAGEVPEIKKGLPASSEDRSYRSIHLAATYILQELNDGSLGDPEAIFLEQAATRIIDRIEKSATVIGQLYTNAE